VVGCCIICLEKSTTPEFEPSHPITKSPFPKYKSINKFGRELISSYVRKTDFLLHLCYDIALDEVDLSIGKQLLFLQDENDGVGFAVWKQGLLVTKNINPLLSWSY
jgi:hypothetical protein